VARRGEGQLVEQQTTTFEADVHPDAERVLDWRFAELCRVGFTSDQAWRLASTPEVDIRAAERMLVAGCPPATAQRILL
jgi:hypothetical protein